jgi:hypothetical protein
LSYGAMVSYSALCFVAGPSIGDESPTCWPLASTLYPVCVFGQECVVLYWRRIGVACCLLLLLR